MDRTLQVGRKRVGLTLRDCPSTHCCGISEVYDLDVDDKIYRKVRGWSEYVGKVSVTRDDEIEAYALIGEMILDSLEIRRTSIAVFSDAIGEGWSEIGNGHRSGKISLAEFARHYKIRAHSRTTSRKTQNTIAVYSVTYDKLKELLKK